MIDEIDKKKEWREKFMEEIGLNIGTYQSHVNDTVTRIDKRFEEIWEELEDELEETTQNPTKIDIEEANEKHIDIILYRIKKIILDNKKSRNKIKK